MKNLPLVLGLLALEINMKLLQALGLITFLIAGNANADSIDQDWSKTFMSKNWQTLQGLSCGESRMSFTGDVFTTNQFGKTHVRPLKVSRVNNSEKIIEIHDDLLIKDNPNLKNIFPLFGDSFSGKNHLNIKVLSDHKAYLVQTTQMIDLMAMLKNPNDLKYDEEKTQSFVIFDCN